MSIEHLGKAILASIKESAKSHRESGSELLSSAAAAINQGDIETARQILQQAEPDLCNVRQKEDQERKIQAALENLLLVMKESGVEDFPEEEGATILIDSIPASTPVATPTEQPLEVQLVPQTPVESAPPIPAVVEHAPTLRVEKTVDRAPFANGKLTTMEGDHSFPMTDKEYYATLVFLRLMDSLPSDIQMDVATPFQVLYPPQLRKELPEAVDGYTHVLRNNFKWGKSKLESHLKATFGIGDIMIPVTSEDAGELAGDPKIKEILERLSRVKEFTGFNLSEILNAYDVVEPISIRQVVEKIIISRGSESNGRTVTLEEVSVSQLIRLIDMMTMQEYTWSSEFQRAAVHIKGTTKRVEKLTHADREELLERTIAVCRCSDRDWEKFSSTLDQHTRTVLMTVRNFYRRRPDSEISQLLRTRKKR